jgi:predicted transcriptional regulator
MNTTKKAGDMAQEGFAAEDIAALLQTTPAVVRTLLHRTKSGGKPLYLRLPDHTMSELEKRSAGKSMSAKSLAQIMLVKILEEK